MNPGVWAPGSVATHPRGLASWCGLSPVRVLTADVHNFGGATATTVSATAEAVRAEAGPLTRGPDPTRRAAERSGASTGIRRVAVLPDPPDPPRGAVAVAVVTARRAGTRSQRPGTASTRDIAAAAQPGDRRESERSERPGEHDRRARAMAQRARLMRRGRRSR